MTPYCDSYADTSPLLFIPNHYLLNHPLHAPNHTFSVRDHLTLLAAFAEVARREAEHFGRFASTAAEEYEYWALSVVPARARRAASRSASGSGSFSSSTNPSPAVSRRSSGREYYTPTPTALSIAAAMGMSRAGSEPTPTSAGPSLPTPTSAGPSWSSIGTTSKHPRRLGGPLGLALPLSLEHHHSPASPTHVHSPGTLSPFSSVSSLPSSPASDTPRRRQPLPASELPPLPVLMAWHAHLLNPGQYAADTAPSETYAALADILFPLADVAAAIRAGTLPSELEHVPEVHSSSISGWRVPDISAAMQRQVRMVSVVRDLGWLDESFTQGPIAPLQRAIVRYHCWLDLFAATRAQRFGPTMDIELVWRTHQLRGAAYRAETERLLGQALDQTDRGDDDLLRKTGALWAKRFGHDYVEAPAKHHGMPLPPGFRRPIRRSTV